MIAYIYLRGHNESGIDAFTAVFTYEKESQGGNVDNFLFWASNFA